MKIFSSSRFCILSVMWGEYEKEEGRDHMRSEREGGPRREKQEDSSENFHPKTFTKEG